MTVTLTAARTPTRDQYADDVRDAELRYAQRYRTPRVNPRRVVIEVRIERVLGSSELLDRGEA